MSKMKAKVEAGEVLSFLQNQTNSEIHEVMPIAGGEMSKAFLFRSDGKDFVIRLSQYPESFQKDKYAYEHFATDEIPIPQVIEIGRFDNQHSYCISEAKFGKIIDEWDSETQKKLYPKLYEILDKIHSSKIEVDGKYGWWKYDGKAEFNSWNEYILKPRTIHDSPFFEKEFAQKVYDRMKDLGELLPTERLLIHGDFAGNNALSDGENITGIIDWGNSAYGDFLFDIAYMQFWQDDPMHFYEGVKEQQAEWGRNIENYEQRVKCYLLHVGLGAIEFWSRANMKEKYRRDKDRILKILNYEPV